MLLKRAGQTSALHTGAALQKELQEAALRFLVHIPSCASCLSCALRAAKEHVSLQGHFTELQND